MNNNISLKIDHTEFVQKTKEFLKNVAKNSPLGITLQTTDNDVHAVVYEAERFVIVVPGGTKESAKLYGNWNEALLYTQRLLKEKCHAQNITHLVLTQYKA